MRTLKSCLDITTKDIGSYARFQGQGIIDGLTGEATKRECYEIMDVVLDLKIYVRSYGRKNRGRHLHRFYYDQAVEIYTKSEFNKLKIS